MAFGTFKPCPGCGSTRYRLVKDVCDDCKATLRVGRTVTQEEQTKAEAVKLYRLTKEWPSFYAPNGGDELRHAFEALARVVMRPVRSKKDPLDQDVEELPPTCDLVHYFSTNPEGSSVWTSSRRVAAAITKLDLAVRKALAACKELGEQDGSNLLLQIASGKISVNDLTEASIEAGRREKR